MKIFVTGSSGFIGTHLVPFLLEQQGTSVIGVDFQTPRQEMLDGLNADQKKRFLFIQEDLRKPAFLEEFVQNSDVIYHLAAQTSHTLAMQNPHEDLQTNAAVTLSILETVKQQNPSARVIYPSTSTVIGQLMLPFADEAHPEHPVGLYSAHKLLCEKYFSIYHRAYGLRTAVLRFGNLFGPWGNPSPHYNFINFFIHLAKQQGVLPVFDSGSQIRNVLYVKDAVQVLWMAANRDDMIGKLLFAASPFHHSVRAIAESIADVFEGTQIKHVSTPKDRQRLEVHDAVLCSEQLIQLTGWSPQYDLLSGLRDARACLEKISSDERLMYEKSGRNRGSRLSGIEAL